MVGLIDKLKNVTRSTISEPGHSIVLLGGLSNELGGSYFLQTQYGLKQGKVPEVDLEAEAKLQELLIRGIKERQIESAHDLAEGGCLIAVVEMLFGNRDLGAELKIQTTEENFRLDSLLFGESQGRALVAVAQPNLGSFYELAKQVGVDAQEIGKSNNGNVLSLEVNHNEVMRMEISKLQKIWEDVIPARMQSGQ